MPHNFQGGFYTSTTVSTESKTPTKETANTASHISNPTSGGNTTNQKTESNDREKQ